jgi:pyruvate/2-oxoglutarate dehydrogenase complex dihydrolipoamide dehydrogenase (E3) component
LLPKEEPEAQAVMQKVFEREGIRFVWGKANAVRRESTEIVAATENASARGDMLLVATGRAPNVEGLALEKASVTYTPKGITVDSQLRTSAKHIFAAGDVVGSHQFTHFAGWQAFQAARNALLPGSSAGFTDVVPWTTFTDPEVAHVGLTEVQARKKFGDSVRVTRWEMAQTDRAVCEHDTNGFIKVVHKKDGALLGATIVAGRAGEAITEFVIALQHKFKVSDLAGAIHVYPTYSTAVQQLSADVAIDNWLKGVSGKVVKYLANVTR